MATIVNNPGTGSDSSGMSGLLIGIVLLLALFFLFWIFGLPYLRNTGGGGQTPTTIENNVQAPEVPESAPAQDGDTTINVPIPDEVDVNVRNMEGEQ